MSSIPDIAIPDDLLPHDGRFGCGPSKIRPDAVEMLAGSAGHYLGTSHRQAAVQFKVGELRNGLAEMLSLPDGYEIIIGNGGTTAFWDAATFCLIDERSQHLTFGEFSSKFATAAAAAPFLGEPEVISTDPGDHPLCYCKPGTADDILLNIKNRNFDFKQIDFVIDRYIIDSVTGYSADKYIVFKNDRTTIT